MFWCIICLGTLLATAHLDLGVPSPSGKGGGWGKAPSEQFLLLPMTVRGLQVKAGTEMWEWGGGGCNVLNTPKVLSSRAGNFDLHGPQVRIVWINYWILNTGHQTRNYSSFVHCLKIHKFNTFFKIRNQMHFHPSAVHPKLMTHCVYRSPFMKTAEATLVKRACHCACDRIRSPQGQEITVWGMAWPIKCREFRDKRTHY